MKSSKLTVLVPLLMLATAACQTTQTTATVNPPLRSIPCSQDPAISYSAPKPGQEEDRANAFDSAQTIGDPKTRGTIRNHNAVVKAACNVD